MGLLEKHNALRLPFSPFPFFLPQLFQNVGEVGAKIYSPDQLIYFTEGRQTLNTEKLIHQTVFKKWLFGILFLESRLHNPPVSVILQKWLSLLELQAQFDAYAVIFKVNP